MPRLIRLARARRLCLVAAAVAAAALAPPVRAQSGPDLERQARAAFATGQYDKALEAYVRLYTDAPHPIYLRNIGRCYQNLGQPEKAIANFREYLRQAPAESADQRALIERYIAEMEALQRTRAAAAAVPAPQAPVLAQAPPIAPSVAPPAYPPAAGQVEAAAAPARSRFYLGADLGFSIAGDPDLHIPEPLPADLGTSFLVGAALGYRLASSLRAELSLSYRGWFEQASGSTLIKTGRADFRSLVGLTNLYLDFLGDGAVVRPYLVAGAGLARNSLGTIRLSNPDGTDGGSFEGASRFSFAWQVGAGLSWEMLPRTELGLGYRYLRAGTYESHPTSAMAKDVGSFHAHELRADLRYGL